MKCIYGCGTDVSSFQVNGEHLETVQADVIDTPHTRGRCADEFRAKLAAVNACCDRQVEHVARLETISRDLTEKLDEWKMRAKSAEEALFALPNGPEYLRQLFDDNGKKK